MKVVSNVKFYSDPSNLLDEYLPSVKPHAPTPAVIFVHGGAWTGGDKSEWASYASALVSATSWSAFSINYDLVSNTPFSTEPKDVTAAINWLKSHSKNFNVDGARIGLVGYSAGGHLAMLAGTTGSGSSAAGGRVKGVVSWSGPSDLPLLTQDDGCFDSPCNYGTQWVGNVTQAFEGGSLAATSPAQWASTSPVKQVDPTDARMLLFNSDAEIVGLDQLQEMQSALAAANVPIQTVVYSGSAHGMDYGAQAWPTTLAWLKSNL